ncbi:MAG: hypothetical protein K6G54_05265, partial [Oscillospiraceae bacterium]|nr:hypothetical protein [Oscillospiraceae bacterium]
YKKPRRVSRRARRERILIIFSDDMRVRKKSLRGANVRPQGRAMGGAMPSQSKAVYRFTLKNKGCQSRG